MLPLQALGLHAHEEAGGEHEGHGHEEEEEMTPGERRSVIPILGSALIR